MTLRWPLIASVVALFAGAGLAALILAFCSDSDDGGNGPNVAASATARATRTRVAVSRTTTPTGVAVETPATDETPAPEPTEEPPTEEPGEDTPTPDETPPGEETPLPGEDTPTPAPTAPPATPTATATPTALPDLIVASMSVANDQIVVEVLNQGEGPVAAGVFLEVSVRGIIADSRSLTAPLEPGASIFVILSDQVIYRPEVVLARVDPNDRIAESNEANNGLALSLSPDVVPDLGLVSLSASASRALVVVVANTKSVPIRQAAITLRAFRCGSDTALSAMDTTLDLGPLESVSIEIFPQVIVAPSVDCMRVTLTVTNIPDEDLANNALQGPVVAP